MAPSDLSIVPINIGNLKQPPVKDKILPQHEFSLLIVAAKGSGKTNLICNLLLNHYKGYFHKILVCSPTIENDPKWEVVKSTEGILCENTKLRELLGQKHHVKGQVIPQIVFASEGKLIHDRSSNSSRFDGKIPEDCFFSDMNEIPKRLAVQTETLAKLKSLGYGMERKFLIDRILVIEDDQAGLYTSTPNSVLTNLVLKHRHFGASLIKVTQAYKAMPKAVRTNCNAMVAFEIPNMGEKQVVYEEWPMGLSKNDWMKVFDYATREPFSFIYCNTSLPHGQRVYERFEKLLTVERKGQKRTLTENEEDPKKSNKSV